VTLLESPDSPVTEAEKEALIKEARRLRRRRWWFGSTFSALVIGGGIAGYLIKSGPPSAPHRAAPARSLSAPGWLASARASVPTRSPDLLQPSSLATLANGNVLILDSSRDQILALKANGDLSVFAGTGRLGSSGDGGPARDADLDFVSGESAGMTVTRSGAVDFLDDGNCRIRQISSDGTLRTLFRFPLVKDHPGGNVCPLSAFAASPTGALYVATSSQVERVSRSGRLVWVAGSSRSSDFEPSHPTRSNVALEPDALAFNRVGDVFISSFALKLVFELTPAGKLTDLGESYADQLTLDPNGEMLVGTHEGFIQEITPAGIKPFYNVIPRRAGINWGSDQGFQEDGIAVTRTGTIYVDNSQGNGYGDGTVIVRISPSRHASIASIRTPVVATLPKVGAPGFPAAIYPAARPARGSAVRSCPSDSGLEPFNRAAVAQARKIAGTYLTGQFASDLAVTDRSWWTEAFDKVAGGDIAGRNTVTGEAPASKIPVANSLAQACGQELVDDTITVTIGKTPYSHFTGTLYLLDRHGHPLVYDAK
jgi:anti-sigma factor RsiW